MQTGAYQEVMGNLHNLFGSTNAVHLRLKASGGYQLDHVVRGDTNAEVLEAMEHNPERLLERLSVASEAAIAKGSLAIADARRLPSHVQTRLRESTYLQPLVSRQASIADKRSNNARVDSLMSC